MAKKEMLGHIGPCVCCGFAEMEVRADKNGHPYAYCPECSAQVLTHGRPERVNPMLKRMRPVVAAAPLPEKPAAPAPAKPAAAAEVPKPPAAPPKKETKPPAAPDKAKPGAWVTLLDEILK